MCGIILFIVHRSKTYLQKIYSGPESLQKIKTFGVDLNSGGRLDTNPLIEKWVNLGQGIVAEELEINYHKSIRPFRPKHPSELAFWMQLRGNTLLRVGGTVQRARFERAEPGDVVAVEGHGKRSLENPHMDEPSLGFYASVVPIEVAVDHEITIQDAQAAVQLCIERNPDAIPYAGTLIAKLENGKLTPADVYSYAQRNTPEA